MSDELATWLLEQMDEDEKRARAASPGPWHANAEHDEVWAVDDVEVASGFALSSAQLRATVDHMVAWDPVRVLAECAAKRQMVETYLKAREVVRQNSTDIAAYETTRVLEPLLRAWGVVYADRPGFREEWRPDTSP